RRLRRPRCPRPRARERPPARSAGGRRQLPLSCGKVSPKFRGFFVAPWTMTRATYCPLRQGSDPGRSRRGTKGWGQELISKWLGEDEDHAEVEEGEVVVGFAVAAGGDAAFCFQPGVGALDGEAMMRVAVGGAQPSLLSAPHLSRRRSGRDRFAFAARLADPWLDRALAQGLLDRV